MPSFATFGNDLYTGRRSFDFVHHARRPLGFAAVLVLACLAILGIKGLNPSIEFRGGSEFRVSDVASTDTQPAVDAVEQVAPDSATPQVSVVGGDSIRVQTEQLGDDQTSDLSSALASTYGVDPSQVTSSYVGPSWGADVTRQAVLGLVIFLVLVSIVITIYFRDVAMAGAAMLALAHDLVVTAGIYALVGFEVSPATVIGFLTILGYSLYDTVVVFDKVRENTHGVLEGSTRTYLESVNLAVNQTLIRSINTSVVAVLPVAAILFIGALLLGAGTLRDIALALFVGMIAGTYSSIFIAPAFLGAVRGRSPQVRAQAERVRARRAERAARAEAAAAATDAAGEPVAVGAGAGPAARVAAGGGGQRPQPRRRRGRPGERRS